MATSQQSFQLGILPERKIDRRAVATGYAFIVVMILLFINIGLLFPDRIQLKEYRVTALIPLPSMRPEPEPIKVKPVAVKAKLLPPAPVFEQPRLIVPHEVHRTPAPESIVEQPGDEIRVGDVGDVERSSISRPRADVGIRIRLEHIDPALRVHSKVNAGVIANADRVPDARGERHHLRALIAGDDRQEHRSRALILG